MVDIAQNIRVERARRDWTQQELARRSGVHATKISVYESGTAQPNLTTLIRLAEAFEMPLSTLTAETALTTPPSAQQNTSGHRRSGDDQTLPAVNGAIEMPPSANGEPKPR